MRIRALASSAFLISSMWNPSVAAVCPLHVYRSGLAHESSPVLLILCPVEISCFVQNIYLYIASWVSFRFGCVKKSHKLVFEALNRFRGCPPPPPKGGGAVQMDTHSRLPWPQPDETAESQLRTGAPSQGFLGSHVRREHSRQDASIFLVRFDSIRCLCCASV